MVLEYSDILNYDRVPVETNIGTIPQREVVEGGQDLLSSETVISQELQGDMEIECIEEFNENNRDPYRRLERYILDADRDIFFMDDHHHALSAWLAASNEGDIGSDAVLLHIDAHPDYEKPAFFYPPQNTEESIEKISSDLRINEFIYPAEDWDLFSDVRNWGIEDQNITRLFGQENLSFVFDLDLDVFEKIEDRLQFSDVKIEDYYDILAGLMSRSEFATVATSPGYISQDSAMKHLDEIMERYDKKSI